MTRVLVASHYIWDDYPGLRIGRLASGAQDLGRHPRGETHALAEPDDARTVCGRPRSEFAHDFAEPVRLSDAKPCADCGIASDHQGD